MSEDLKEFLHRHGIKNLSPAFQKLMEYGVTEVAEISLLTERDLLKAGLNLIQCRALLRDCAGHTSHTSVTFPMSELQLDYSIVRQSPKQKSQFQIKYVLCIHMFTSNQEEHSLGVNPEQDTMEFLIRQICSIHGIADNLTLELYNKNGTPLNVNEYTSKLTLDKWQVKINDSYYVLPRRKEQPFWSYQEICDEAIETPEEPVVLGRSNLKVQSEIYGNFTIKVKRTYLTVKAVLQRVSKLLNVPSKYLKVHKSIHKPPMNQDDLILFDNDEDFSQGIVIRLTELYPARTDFGKPSYIPLIEQTEKGLAKFYSILKYLVLNRELEHLNFVSAVFKLTNCVPLTAALHHFTMSQSFSHLSYLAILFEGFYSLSKAILQHFCNVDDKNIFEFFDYIFGFIQELSQKISNDECLKLDEIVLACPITGFRIIEPVMIMGQSSYERKAAIEKLKAKEHLPDCTIHVKKEDLLPSDDQLLHYLIVFSFSSSNMIQVLQDIPEGKLNIMPIIFTHTWKELMNSNVAIFPPKLTLVESLTYNKEGHVSVFYNVIKSSELHYVLYNPITCYSDKYTIEELKEFASYEGKTSHNLVNFLHPKIKALLPPTQLSSSNNDKLPNADGITREPHEAIMVLLDTSSSMNTAIFQDNADGYKRITAAVDFFLAFARRTQAYEFHHVVGALYFNDAAKEILPLSQSLVNFKSTIEKVKTEASGQTALYDALKKGATAFSKLTSQYPLCQKRILCLTDGEDNKSSINSFEVAKFLASEKVIVDAVVINSNGNQDLKAISHATGGLCFMPVSRQEGISLFEMEILLSVRQRTQNRRPILHNQDAFERIKRTHSYDSTDPYSFKSSFAMEIDKSVTCSAKRMIVLASFIGNGSSHSSGQQPHAKPIMRELRKYEKNPHKEFAIFPDEQNICFWKILLKGPGGTPYGGGTFLLLAKFPKEYPYKPPEIRFVTPIYHCNINSVGRICHPILGRNYIPSLSIRVIFDHIYGLLMAPEPDNPLDSVIAEEFHVNKDLYMRKARRITKDKATAVTWEDYMKDLSGETTEANDELKCPLTGKLFVNPVSTPYGHTYERDALLIFMAANNNMDPKAKQPLMQGDLHPNVAIKKLAENVRKLKLV